MPSALRRYRQTKVSSAVTASRASASSKAASASKARCRPVKATRRSLQVRVRPVRHRRRAGQTTFRLRHAYGEWGPFLAGQTNSLFMDSDVFPNTIDYWGPRGHGLRAATPQIRWTPFRTDSSHFAVAIERPGNDIDAGNIRLIERLRGCRDPERRGAARPDGAVPLNGDWGHVQVGGILRKIGFESSGTADDEPQTAARSAGASTCGSAINTFGKRRSAAGGRLRRGHRQLHERRRHGPRAAAATARHRRSALSRRPVVPLTGVGSRTTTTTGAKVVELHRLQLHRGGQHQLPGPRRFHKGEYASVNLLTYPAREPHDGRRAAVGRARGQ